MLKNENFKIREIYDIFNMRLTKHSSIPHPKLGNMYRF